MQARHRVLLVATFAFAPLLHSHAQITLDGTLGRAGALNGPNYSITADLGRQVGGNLFHSFGRFSVHNGESATFSGPGNVSNIIGRVTGGSSSTIDGLMRSTIAGANLFLINPSGIVFGPNATLDVSGSFYASTADYLALGGGGRFDATHPAATILVSAPPSAFGFLSAAPRAIEVNGSFLTAAPGKSVSLVGGNVSIADSGVLAQSASINVVSIGGLGEAPIAGGEVMLPSGVHGGEIQLTNSLLVANSAAGPAPGRVVIRGGTLQFVDSFVSISNSAPGPGGGVTIEATGEVAMRGGFVQTRSQGPRSAGDVTVNARVVTLAADAQIVSLSEGAGPGGAVSLNASDSMSASGAAFLLTATENTSGGKVALSAPSLALSDASIASLTSGRGQGGAIDIDVGTLTLRGGSQLISRATSSGRGGPVSVSASEMVSISGFNANVFSGIVSTAAAGGAGGSVSVMTKSFEMNDGLVRVSTLDSAPGGSLAIDAHRITIGGGGELGSVARATGAGGDVNLIGRDSVIIEGQVAGFSTMVSATSLGSGRAGHVSIRSPQVIVRDGALINGSAQGAGPGGDIAVDADRIVLANGGRLFADSLSTGRGGSIDLSARESLSIGEVATGSVFTTFISTEALAGGSAGNISITGGALNADHAFISSRATASGAAGSIDVTVSELTLKNSAQINSATRASGRGGTVNVNASDVSIDGGSIFADTSGTGAAGNVSIRANRVMMTNGAQIDSSSSAAGDAGTLTIRAAESFTMSGAPSAAQAPTGLFNLSTNTGNGGNVFVSAPVIALDGGGIDAHSSGSGAAGSITLEGRRIALTGGFAVFASADGTGPGGTLTVTAGESLLISGRDAFNALSGLNTRSLGSGRGGDIVIRTALLSMDDGLIRSRASGSGAAGNISIAAGRVAIAGGALIDAGTTGSGAGGSLHLSATDGVSLSGGSSISAISRGAGNAGNINISGGSSLTMDAASITTQADTADGGNITIAARDIVRLTKSQISTAVGTGSGNGGNITIDPTFVVLNDSHISANAFGGNGGNILIVTDALLKSGTSSITASSSLGVQGTIRITAPESDLVGGLRALPGALFDPSLLLRESCSARAARAANTFVDVGQGGVPYRPDAMAFSTYAELPFSETNAAPFSFALAQAFGIPCGY